MIEGRIRSSLRKWLGFGALALAAFVSFTSLRGFYERKIHTLTGNAQWIWMDRPIIDQEPVTFFATKNFRVPAKARGAVIRIGADPWYTLYLNERQIGAGGWAGRQAIDQWNVSDIIRREDVNRIVVACRSAEGVGGLIVSIDFGPMMGAMVVSDTDWRIFRRRTEDLLVRDPDEGERPIALGPPPVGKWNYPSLAVRQVEPTVTYTRTAVSAMAVEGALPDIEVIAGVAVAGSRHVPGTLFDFGREVVGRPRLILEPGPARAVPVRMALERSELDEVVAPVMISTADEETVVDLPEIRAFRFLMVYAEGIDAAVVTASPG
ncbi:MAG: hypothetical protein KY459_04555 [Acidobacteria bacterium]|nr:hypothetical protein [Acidobacteriota bacterium]